MNLQHDNARGGEVGRDDDIESYEMDYPEHSRYNDGNDRKIGQNPSYYHK